MCTLSCYYRSNVDNVMLTKLSISGFFHHEPNIQSERGAIGSLLPFLQFSIRISIQNYRFGAPTRFRNESVALRVEWLWNRRVEYWAIRFSVCSFARTAHSGAHGEEVCVFELNASISFSFNPLCGGSRDNDLVVPNTFPAITYVFSFYFTSYLVSC